MKPYKRLRKNRRYDGSFFYDFIFFTGVRLKVLDINNLRYFILCCIHILGVKSKKKGLTDDSQGNC